MTGDAPSKFSRKAQGFTLIEMLTTVAALIIILGLMVSLARHVRTVSSIQVTEQLLATLGLALQQYVEVHKATPPVTPLITRTDVSEPELRRRARSNNTEFMSAIFRSSTVSPSLLEDVPGTLVRLNELWVRDAWGSPLVLMPRFDRAIGMAREDRPFFFSAGPDRQYLTREDNLYSYEAEELP